MSDLIKIDESINVFRNGSQTAEEISNLIKLYESLNEREKKYFDTHVMEIQQIVNRKIKKERLIMATEYKNMYEKQIKQIFKKIRINALTEIYETSKCLNLNLSSGVYFLRNKTNGLLKIGFAKDLSKRIKQIKTAFNHVGYDDELELVAIHMCFEPHLDMAESFFHKEFENYRAKGEWFKISDKELEDFFLLGDFEGEFIDEIIVSYSDYESFRFPKMARDYEINVHEMEYELFEKDIPISSSEHFMRTKVRNKLYKITKIVEENNVTLYALDFDTFPTLKRVGVKSLKSNKELDFMKLKEEKFNLKEIEKIVKRIQRALKVV